MATPAVNTILTEIGARLSLITTANGYNYTFKKVEEARLEPFVGYDLPAINYWLTNVSNESSIYNNDSRSIELAIEAFSATRDESFTRVVSKLAADVVTALTRKTSSPKISDDPNYNLDETVSDFLFNGYDYEIGEGQKPWCGALLQFTIKYQSDPFEMSAYGS